MSYQEQYDKAVKNKTARSVVTALKTDWGIGEILIGKLVKIIDVKFEESGNTVNGYVFDTDDGLVQTTLGAAVDLQAKDVMIIGDVYSCTFKGKKDISGGRSLNIYEILNLSEVKHAENTKSEKVNIGQTGKK